MVGARTRDGYTVRKLPSGRFQAVIRASHDGKQVGIGSYSTRKAAERAGQEAAMQERSHLWVDPRKSDVPLAQFMRGWLKRKASSGAHGDKYQVDAARMLRLYIAPTIGKVLLTDLQPGHVADWLDKLKADRLAADGRVGLVPAKTYRLLHACLHDAYEQRYIAQNPCIFRGSSKEVSPERPLVTSEQVALLAAEIHPRWSALVLVCGWAGLRFGEAQRLVRSDVDLLHGTIRIRQAKTAAGVRTVHLPPQLVAVLEKHMATFTRPDPEAWVFCGERGGAVAKSFLGKEFRRARTALGLEAVTVHDLRHHAGTMTAVSGATQREIMARLGHASPRAAMRYQHAAESRASEVADRLGALMPSAPADGVVRKIRG